MTIPSTVFSNTFGKIIYKNSDSSTYRSPINLAVALYPIATFFGTRHYLTNSIPVLLGPGQWLRVHRRTVRTKGLCMQVMQRIMEISVPAVSRSQRWPLCTCSPEHYPSIICRPQQEVALHFTRGTLGRKFRRRCLCL